MRASELRAALEGVPDDAIVVNACEHDGWVPFAHPVTSVYTHVNGPITAFVLSPSFSQVNDLPEWVNPSYDDEDGDEDGHPRDESGRLTRCDDAECEVCC